jgi:hypothetical protein
MKKFIIMAAFLLVGGFLFAQSDEEILESFLDGALYQIDQLEEAWKNVNEKVLKLESNNAELILLVEQSGKQIEELKLHLASAEEGVLDSLENWWHMEQLLSQADREIAAWNKAYNKLARQQRVGPIIFSVGIGAGTAGGYFLGNGIVNSNSQQIITGCSIIGGITAIYLIGHFALSIW